MNRTDRLLAILLELQARRRRRAEDLAETFEISKRTIYRDIEALCEAGVPIIAVPGQGYSLVPGYFLPPLMFSPDEATMLLLGSEVVAQSFDPPMRAVARSAARKIEAVLPQKAREEVRYLQSSIAFIPPSAGTNPDTEAMLGRLRHAIVERARVRFRYHARNTESRQEAPDRREADPYALVHYDTAWYLSAYCHTRKAVRNFRLDRMEDLSLLGETFSRPADIPLGQRAPSAREVVVRALFAPEATRWVREARSFYMVAEEETPEGLLLTFRAWRESDLLGWLLSWGAQVRVLEPESLRRKIAEEAEKIAQYHRSCSR